MQAAAARAKRVTRGTNNIDVVPHPSAGDSTFGRLARQMERLCWVLFAFWFAEGLVVAPIGGYSSGSQLFRDMLHSSTYFLTGSLLWITVLNLPLLSRTAQRAGLRFGLVTTIALLSSLQVVNGLFHAQVLRLYPVQMIADFLPLLSCLLAYVGAVFLAFRESFKRMIGPQVLVVGALILWILWRYPISFGRPDVTEPHFFAMSIGNIAIIGLASIHLLKWRDKIFVLTGVACYAIMVLAYQSRGASINTFVILPVTLAIAHIRARTFSMRAIRAMGLVAAPVAVALFLLLSEIPFVSSQALDGSRGTSQRLFQNDIGQWDLAGFAAGVDDEMAYSRGLEAEEFVSKATGFVWLFGNGMAGTWPSDVMNHGDPWPIVHFGPLHMVLKGGVTLAFAYICVYLLAIWRSWRALRSTPWAVVPFTCLVLYLSDFSKHGPVVHSYYTSLNWIVVGIGLSFVPSGHVSRLVNLRRFARTAAR